MRLTQRATLIATALAWTVTAAAKDAAPLVVTGPHDENAAPLIARAALGTSVRPAERGTPPIGTSPRAATPTAPSTPARTVALATLRAELTSSDPDLVEHAMLGLAELGGRDALTLLLTRIRRGLPARLAEPAILALVTFRQPATAPVLFELSQHRRWQVRQKAFEALGQLGAASTQSSLLYALGDPSAEVRSAAVQALGRVGDHRALPGLSLALEREVAGAALALARIGGSPEAALLLSRARAGSLDTVQPALHVMLMRTNLPLRTKLTIVHEISLLPGVEGSECLAAWKANSNGLDPRVLAAVTASLASAGGSVAMATSEARVDIPGDRPMIRPNLDGLAPLPLLLLLGACGATSFDSKFQTPVAPTELQVAREISSARPRHERPVAVGITTDPATLCAWDLSTGLLWQEPVDALSNPLVVGDAVVLQERNGIFVRDLATGKPRTVIDDEGILIGADGLGSTVVVAVRYDGDDTRAQVTLVDGDTVRWRRALSQPAGVPALLGDRVVVPWATQRLSVLETSNGNERARWNFTNLVMGHALVDRGRVFVGEHGLTHVTEALPAHLDGPLTVQGPIKRTLPGQPTLMRDGYTGVPAPDSAHNRLELDWRVAAAGAAQGVEQDLLVARFYRIVFGLSASTDQVRWVRTFDHDVIGSRIEPGGLWLVDDVGDLRIVDPNGSTRHVQSLGKALRMVTLRPSTWLPAKLASAALEAPPASLHDQLLEAARVNDVRLSAARGYAVEWLARQPEAAVTAELIELCSDGNSPERVTLTACAQLAQRGTGGPDVLSALRRRGSFLDQTQAPPVGALAQAAARMNLRQAAPLLVSHAEDPHTSSADLPFVFGALVALEHRPAISSLERFVRLHHAEPSGSDLTPPLYAALSALGSLRAQGTRPTLDDVAADPLTTSAVREKAREVIGVFDAPAVAAKAAVVPAVAVEEVVDAVQTDPRPYSLGLNDVLTTTNPLRKALLRCVENDPEGPKSARISMVVTGDGAVEGIFVTPPSMQQCMDPVLRTARFPPTRLRRQHLTHTLQLPQPGQ